MSDTIQIARSKSRASISAFVVCMNEEEQIERCLESVKWCDEIIVIDSGSTDRTLEICQRYTNKIFQRPWPGYVAQKRFGLEQCSTEWALNLDADEEVSPELCVEIVTILSKDDQTVNGYQVSRVVYFLERWWRRGGWYPEYRLRLCRRKFTTWGGDDPHEKALVSGPVRRLKGELFHYTYSNFTDQVRTLNSYSTQAARSMFTKGRRGNKFKMFLNPLMRFLKSYLLKRGFREGFPGLLVACLEAYYVFLKYMKLWELEYQASRTKKEPEPPYKNNR